MDDNKNQNQPKTADYQKILDEYAASVKKEEESEPEEKELTPQEKPIENVPLKEADPEHSTPVEPVIPEPTHTLTDDLEEEMTKTPPVPEDKPATAELKSINSPQLEAPIHPSLAANLEDEDDIETQPQPQPQPPVVTPKPEIEFTPEPTPQEEKPLTPQPETSLPENQEIPQIQKSPEEVKAEIEKILNDDSKNNSEPIETPVVTKKSGSPKTFFIFALILFFLVIAAMVYFLFLAPTSSSNSDLTATPTTTPTTSVVSDGSCDLNGSTYSVGESFDSADGCNTCTCASAGVITCTEMACEVTPEVISTTPSATTSTTITPVATSSADN